MYNIAMEEKTYITKENQEELKQELEMRLSIKRQEIKDQLEFAKSLGDLSENAEYHQAREDQGRNEDRISEIEHILQTAEVVTKAKHGTVDIGARVTIQKKGDKDAVEYTIVGGEEADIAEAKISYLSPIGAAIFGKSAGDTVTVDAPKGQVIYSIISIK
jgi:transcription elongation factor GreA